MTKTCPTCNKEFKNLGSHLKKHAKETEDIVRRNEIVKDMKSSIDETIKEQGIAPVAILPVAEMEKGELIGKVEFENPINFSKENPEPANIDIPLTEEIVNTPQEVEPVTNLNNCEYYLEMSFNNETQKCYTNNLDVSIQSFAKNVLTEMFIKIKKGETEFLRKLTLVQGKMLFSDAQSREIFLEQFYGLYGRPTKI